MKDGGPAFPQTGWKGSRDDIVVFHGMSLRDYFAAAALPGCQFLAIERVKANGITCTTEDHAAMAYQLADAMLAERSKP
jgi:hypothetical protein